MMKTLKQNPVVKADMLIRRPVREVFEAFVDPDITAKFWFTKGSGRLEAGTYVKWEWEMYGVSDEVYVEELVQDKLIRITSSDGTRVEWRFQERSSGEATFVTIVNSGFAGDGDEVVAQAIDSMGGYTMVLCGLKAYLEHNMILNLVADKAPDAHVTKKEE